MKTILALLVGAAAGRLVWILMRSWLDQPLLARVNYRNKSVCMGLGVVILVAALVVEAGHAFASIVVHPDDVPSSSVRLGIVLAIVGFGFAGLLDDLLGAGAQDTQGTQGERGFKGHLGAAKSLKITTGLLKIGIGCAIALPVAVLAGSGTGFRIVVDAITIALTANLVNLFDRAPGRAIKVSVVLGLLAAIFVRQDATSAAAAPVLGASVGVMLEDLHERAMLGDVGSNALGAAIGVVVIAGDSAGLRVGWLIAVLLLTIVSEFVSFSKVIAKVAPLRGLDELGRLGLSGPGRA